jgi:hypothetical protein
MVGADEMFDVQMEVSGYHHNVAYDFLSLRPLYSAGTGEARFSISPTGRCDAAAAGLSSDRSRLVLVGQRRRRRPL